MDDSIDFLSNLSLRLAPNLAFQLYDSPANALAALNSKNKPNTPIERFFSRYLNELGLTFRIDFSKNAIDSIDTETGTQFTDHPFASNGVLLDRFHTTIWSQKQTLDTNL